MNVYVTKDSDNIWQWNPTDSILKVSDIEDGKKPVFREVFSSGKFSGKTKYPKKERTVYMVELFKKALDKAKEK